MVYASLIEYGWQSLENKKRTLNVFSDWGGMFGFVLFYEIQKIAPPSLWLTAFHSREDMVGVLEDLPRKCLLHRPWPAKFPTVCRNRNSDTFTPIKPTKNTCKDSAKEVKIITISKDTKLKQIGQCKQRISKPHAGSYQFISTFLLSWCFDQSLNSNNLWASRSPVGKMSWYEDLDLVRPKKYQYHPSLPKDRRASTDPDNHLPTQVIAIVIILIIDIILIILFIVIMIILTLLAVRIEFLGFIPLQKFPIFCRNSIFD